MAQEGLAGLGYATRWLPSQDLAQGLRITIGSTEQMNDIIAGLRDMAEALG